MNRSLAALFATLVIAVPSVTLAESLYHDDIYQERFFFAANHDAQPRRAGLSNQPQMPNSERGQETLPQGKTRDEVREELRNMSVDEKRRMQELYAN